MIFKSIRRKLSRSEDIILNLTLQSCSLQITHQRVLTISKSCFIKLAFYKMHRSSTPLNFWFSITKIINLQSTMILDWYSSLWQKIRLFKKNAILKWYASSQSCMKYITFDIAVPQFYCKVSANIMCTIPGVLLGMSTFWTRSKSAQISNHLILQAKSTCGQITFRDQ